MIGQEILEDILTHPGSRIDPVTHGNFKGGWRFIDSSGRGATFDADGVFQYSGVIDEPSSTGVACGRTDRGGPLPFPFTSERAYRRHFKAFDEVDAGLELVLLSRLRLELRWEMQGEREMLSLRTHRDLPSVAAWQSLDVSQADEWARMTFSPITAIAGAWHSPCEGCEELWAVRLTCDAENVVVALGEAGDGSSRIRYMPDSLVVIFDEGEAKAYETLASFGSSWGGIVAAST